MGTKGRMMPFEGGDWWLPARGRLQQGLIPDTLMVRIDCMELNLD